MIRIFVLTEEHMAGASVSSTRCGGLSVSYLPDEMTYYPPVVEGGPITEPRTNVASLFEYLLGDAIREASVTTMTDLPLLSVSAETKAFWKAHAGNANAKARRRWRRRNIPNSQREADRAVAEADFQRWHATVYGYEEEYHERAPEGGVVRRRRYERGAMGSGGSMPKTQDFLSTPEATAGRLADHQCSDACKRIPGTRVFGGLVVHADESVPLGHVAIDGVLVRLLEEK